MTPPLMTDCAEIDARCALTDRLTRCLLDLRRTIEADLRMLTSTQCLLERIRSGEADRQAPLLVSEMSRLLANASSSSPAAAGQWSAAMDIVELLRGECIRTRTNVSLAAPEATGVSHSAHQTDIAIAAVQATY